jgi:hypothetical protein
MLVKSPIHPGHTVGKNVSAIEFIPLDYVPALLGELT